ESWSHRTRPDRQRGGTLPRARRPSRGSVRRAQRRSRAAGRRTRHGRLARRGRRRVRRRHRLGRRCSSDHRRPERARGRAVRGGRGGEHRAGRDRLARPAGPDPGADQCCRRIARRLRGRRRAGRRSEGADLPGRRDRCRARAGAPGARRVRQVCRTRRRPRDGHGGEDHPQRDPAPLSHGGLRGRRAGKSRWTGCGAPGADRRQQRRHRRRPSSLHDAAGPDVDLRGDVAPCGSAGGHGQGHRRSARACPLPRSVLAGPGTRPRPSAAGRRVSPGSAGRAM
ncbi:MAG: hypothetical protein AVDCRST_MAG52-2549, partial [uncultured Blastococcus sp.]